MKHLNEFLNSIKPEFGSIAFSGITCDPSCDVKGKLVITTSTKECKGAAATLQVDDPELLVQDMAKWHLLHTKAKLIGVTGSVGKSITHEFINTLLQTKYKVSKVSYDPLSILNNVNEDDQFCLIELGPKDIKNEIASFDIVIATYIALCKMQHFEDLESIARTTAQIFSKLAIINFDSPFADLLVQLAPEKKITYSVHSLLADVKLQVEDTFIRLNERGKKIDLPFVALPQPHMYSSLVCAIVCAKACQMSYEEIAPALKNITLGRGYLELVEKHGITFIRDGINTSEVSAKASLSYVQKRHVTGRKIAVFDQMPELGRFSKECHARVGEHALACVEKLFCVGDECAPMIDIWEDKDRQVSWHKEHDALVESLRNELQEGDLVLLKGSLDLERILEAFSR